MKTSTLLESLSPETLKELIREVIREEAQLRNIAPQETKLKYYGREEVATLLKISLPTLHEYTKEGRIKAVRIKGRVLYSEEAIKEALKVVPTTKGKRA